MTLRVKRVYEQATQDDGYRVLVDRLWPRGETHEKAAEDLWLKEIGPSTELRKWFGHDPANMAEFKERYFVELDQNPAVAELEKIIHEHPTVTLLYAAKDPKINHAVVLKEYLDERS